MKIHPWNNKVIFIIITLVSIIIAFFIESLIHESGHYLVARAVGTTISPDPIQAVITTPVQIIQYQIGIFGFSETFNYIPYISGLSSGLAGLVSMGGLLFNALVATLCFWIFLKTQGIRYKSLMTISLWILIFNLGRLFSYIPLRVFSTAGDIGFFLSSLWIHPLIFLFPTLILIAAGLIIYYIVILPLYYISIPVKLKALRVFILICSTIILLMYMTDPILAEFSLSDILTLPEITSIFPIIVTGQCIFLFALVLVGLLRLNTLQSSRYLGAKKKAK
ncbi:hypothetical protein [Methanospirillum sp.]|uniref:hypothetical protein n=1 Tax=Methanospirillum sp. TaxID=45200 RepID=UPI0029872B52|nr:hypothetical protein [Methanospirillum sp.]